MLGKNLLSTLISKETALSGGTAAMLPPDQEKKGVQQADTQVGEVRKRHAGKEAIIVHRIPKEVLGGKGRKTGGETLCCIQASD